MSQPAKSHPRRPAATGLLALAILSTAIFPISAGEPPAVSPEARARIDEKLRRLDPPPDQPDGAERFFALKRSPTDGEATPFVERYLAAGERRLDMPRYSTRLGKALPTLRQSEGAGIPDSAAKAAALGTWEPLGPGNIGGRTRALLIHPTQPGTMYAAGVSGGIWKTTSAGSRWTPLADLAPNIAVSAMAMDPGDPRVIYAGTGEGHFREVVRGTGLPLRGAGIFKTTNGRGFVRLSSTRNSNFHWVNDIVVSAGDSRRVYAATRTGVWRSRDAGVSWQRILAPAITGGCFDLALRTDRPSDTLFASCGTFEQATVFRRQAAESDGTWNAVLTQPGMGRTSLAIAPSNQDVIYALAASYVPGPGGLFEGGLHAVFRSDQAGVAGSWTVRTDNSDPVKLDTLLLTNPIIAHLGDCNIDSGGNRYSTLGWYTNVIAVDPTDPDVVWAGGVDLFRSDDGGDSWGVVSYWWDSPPSAHADQHVIVFHPSYNGGGNQAMFVGGDGGVWRTGNARAAKATGLGVCDASASGVRWTSLNHGYAVTQFYHGAPYPDGRTVFGGTQDNGTIRGSLAGGIDGWEHILGGDGGYVAVDPTDPDILYAETQGLNLRKSVDGGQSFEPAIDGITDSGGDVLFIVPFTMDPGDPRRLWLGGRRLWRTTDGAASWSAASARFGARVSAVAVDPNDPGHLLAGLETGAVHRHDSALGAGGGTAWPASVPRAGFVTSLTIDPRDSDVAYATYANFGGRHVWKSTDRGASWSPLDGSGAGRLPNIPLHSIVVDPEDSRRLYLGTDLGVFVSVDGGDSWAVENTGFATAVTESLTLSRRGDERRLFAFTHGRGAWRVAIDDQPPGTLQFAAEAWSALESDGVATVAVNRTGGAGGAVAVDVATAGGTATAGVDYAATAGTLRWEAGDASEKSFTVPLLDDGLFEGPETVELALSNPTGGAEVGSPAAAVLTLLDDEAEPGECVAGDTVLCLGGGRFKVEVEWLDFAGNRGPGRVVPGAPAADSGLFWFFAADNWEMLVKALDGCAFNGHHWVFFAATTNVGYTLTVTDTERGRLRRYTNELGAAAPAVTDVEAFATCP